MAGSVDKQGQQRPLQASWAYLAIEALSADTEVRARPGILHSVSINTKGTTSNVLTLYDSQTAAGTVIATIDTTDGVTTLLYDVEFATALTAALTAGVAAKVTIAYR